MAFFVKELVKEADVAGNQRKTNLLYLTATLPAHSNDACRVIFSVFLRPGMSVGEWDLKMILT